MNNEQKDEVVYLYLDDIIPNRFQPREVFDERALKELAVSIKEHGVIQPIIVRNVNGKYEIIAGERRYKASALAGQTKIPAIVRNLDDKESSKVALLENLQRKNLSPIEEARTYQKILEIDQMTQDELAKTMGKSQSAIANKLRLLSLPDEVQDAILKEQISERHARTLLQVPDVNVQKDLLNEIVSTKMSVRLLEDKIKEMYPKEESAPVENLNSENKSEVLSIPDMAGGNFGQNKILPQNGDTFDDEAEFINYGEVSNDDFQDDLPNQLNTNMEMTPVNMDELQSNAQDLNLPTNKAGGIDDLLNIGGNNIGPSVSGGDFKFFNEEVATPEEPKIEKENTGDYFQPTITDTFEEFAPIEDNTRPYTVEEAASKLKDLIEEFKNHGLKVTSDEMDFDKTFQVIVKIEK